MFSLSLIKIVRLNSTIAIYLYHIPYFSKIISKRIPGPRMLPNPEVLELLINCPTEREHQLTFHQEIRELPISWHSFQFWEVTFFQRWQLNG